MRPIHALIPVVLASLALCDRPSTAQSAMSAMSAMSASEMQDDMQDEMRDDGGFFDEAPIDPAGLAFFEKKIRPVLIDQCYRCHSDEAERVRGDFKLDTREGIRRSGDWGAGVVPGDPQLSLVMQAIRYDDDDLQMPPKKKLPDAVIADFDAWIRMGAPDPRGVDEAVVDMPDSEMDVAAGRDFWSFRPPAAVAPPTVRDTVWPKDDIDRFVLAAMEARQLTPVRDADRATLIRRLSFDLTGLPPTPEAVEAFVRDRSPGAVEALVDRLLDAPQFGERWGRHWLDVARYAESSGKETNIVYPHAWRYRDYVIDAFNADEPFDRFLQEQLAGDLLPAADDDERAAHLIATGYLALGPKSHNTRSRAQFAMDLVDEQIDAVTQGMLGLTVSCARCHDHKFDPIPTRDYYAMAGIFLSTETCFGTPATQGNRRATDLVALPAGADVVDGAPITPTLRAALARRRDRAESERERLQAEIRANGRQGNAAQRLRNTRNQIAVIDEILERYDDRGRPTAAGRVAMGAREARVARDARLLVRGELDKAGDTVPRGFLEVLSADVTPAIGRRDSGRRELATWIASDDNPLTARVWVNRVWLHLFGAGLVPTPDNFGRSGRPPTHPELLDHLAVTFMEDGWSTKALVRRLVLTRTYQLGAFHNTRNDRVDPDNTYRWRMSSRSLEAEAVRDAMLAAAGTLDLARPPGSPASPIEGNVRALDRMPGALADAPVRSVYLPVLRDRVLEPLAVFDFAEPAFVTGQREVTNVPSQALYMLNSEAVIAQADAMAVRLLATPGSDVERVTRAFFLALGREPSPTEVGAVKRFFAEFDESQPDPPPRTTARRAGRGARERADRERERFPRNRRRRGAIDTAGDAAAPADKRHLAWSAFCQSLFASAEFRYLN